MKMLCAPPAPDEFRRQPVEQLRMSRFGSLRPEIAGSGDDAASEMLLPDIVYPHACRERAIRTGEPIDQRGTARSPDFSRCRVKARLETIGFDQSVTDRGTRVVRVPQNLRHACLQFFARAMDVAALEQMRPGFFQFLRFVWQRIHSSG